MGAVAVLLVALGLAACGRVGGPAVSPTPSTSAPTAVAPTATPTAGPTATPAPATPTPTAAPSPTASPSPTVTPAVTPTAPPTPTAACWPLTGGGRFDTVPQDVRITDMRVGTADSRDRLVFEFDTQVPPYVITANPDGARFSSSAKGTPYTLLGSAGVAVHIRVLDDHDQIAAGTDLVPKYTALREVRFLGQFEGQADIGIGLSRDVCPTITILSGPPRLVIDFPF